MRKRDFPWRGFHAFPHGSVLLTAIFFFSALFALDAGAQPDSIPAYVTSATIVTTPGDTILGVPNSTSVITLKATSISDLKKAHVSVRDSSNAILFGQEYDLNRVAVYSMSGGYKLSLRFITSLDLGSNTVKVRFEDKDGNMGSAFEIGE